MRRDQIFAFVGNYLFFAAARMIATRLNSQILTTVIAMTMTTATSSQYTVVPVIAVRTSTNVRVATTCILKYTSNNTVICIHIGVRSRIADYIAKTH